MATDSNVYPQRFGRYYLTQKIAMGGMAEIFRGKAVGAEGFEKTVVIKRILPHFCEDESFVTMFKDEARVASHLNHGNVVQIFDFDEVNDLFYIAMEYIEGQDLKRVLDVGTKVERPMSIAQSVSVMIEAGLGLHYAHTREVDGQQLNIIHRDISPHNMMVSYGGEVKIMDFGIAKAASRSTKTRVGTVKGKCAYMSPEQARGKPLDPRSDLFALGVCMWEMLSGKRLFVGESDFETLNNVLRAEVPSLRDLNPEVPEELDRIVLQSLEKDRDERHADVSAWVSDLRRWFYASVPDPDAVNLRDYMHDLFKDQIEKLKQDIAAEASAMTELRTGSHRSAAGGSKPNATQVSEDDATVALDVSGGPAIEADSEATVALIDGTPSALRPPTPGNASQMTMTMQGMPQKSKAGLFLGIGILIALLAGAGAFVGLRDVSEADGASAAVAPTPEAPPIEQVTLKITAEGASEIQVDGETEATGGSTKYTTDKGKEIKILAIAEDGRKELVKVVAERDGQAVVITLPEPKEEDVQVAEEAPAEFALVVLQVEPKNAAVKVNGKEVTLDAGGNVKVTDAKLGDTIEVTATASNYRDAKETFVISDPKLTIHELKLQRERRAVAPSAAPKAPGTVAIAARPWAKVFLGSKELGLTPRKVELPPGRHAFTLKKGSATKTITVTVTSGKTTKTTVDMTN